MVFYKQYRLQRRLDENICQQFLEANDDASFSCEDSVFRNMKYKTIVPQGKIVAT